MSTKTKILIAGGLVLAAWLFWPRKGIKTFYLPPVIIQAGGESADNGG